MLLLASCSQAEEQPGSAKKQFATDAVSVFSNRQKVSLLSLVQDSEANPNRFKLDHEAETYSVKGRIFQIEAFDPLVAPKFGYKIPLVRFKEDEAIIDPALKEVMPKVSVYMDNFDMRAAANLDVGQAIEVRCTGLDVADQCISFNHCRKTNGG